MSAYVIRNLSPLVRALPKRNVNVNRPGRIQDGDRPPESHLVYKSIHFEANSGFAKCRASVPVHDQRFGFGLMRTGVVCDCCGIPQHPWKDRTILRRVMEYEDGVILTANPDRLTRRADEIEELIQQFRCFIAVFRVRLIIDRAMGNDF